MLRRLALTFSLIILFGIAQIGAVAHEFSHYTDVIAQQQASKNSHQPSSRDQAPQHQTPQDQAPQHQVCEKCISYTELGHAISSSHVALPVIADTQFTPSTHPVTPSLSTPLTYSARAPPTLA